MLAVPLSLPIWLPPSCSLADSVLCHQRGGAAAAAIALLPSLGPAGFWGHSLASLTLIYFYGIQSKRCGFMPLRRAAKFNSLGQECWWGFRSLGNVFCQPWWQPCQPLLSHSHSWFTCLTELLPFPISYQCHGHKNIKPKYTEASLLWKQYLTSLFPLNNVSFPK